MIKIHDGTPRSDQPSLCLSCRSCHLVKFTTNETLQMCTALYPAQSIHGVVVRCTRYDDKRVPTIHSMNEIAWKICSDKHGERIGFLSPLQYKRRKESLDDLPPLNIPGLDPDEL